MKTFFCLCFIMWPLYILGKIYFVDGLDNTRVNYCKNSNRYNEKPTAYEFHLLLFTLWILCISSLLMAMLLYFFA